MPMTVPDPALAPKLLAALHETVEAEVVPHLAGGRERESALCIGRLLSRMRLELGHRNELERQFAGDWRALGERLGCAAGGDLVAQARAIGDAVRGGRTLSPDE